MTIFLSFWFFPIQEKTLYFYWMHILVLQCNQFCMCIKIKTELKYTDKS